MLANQELIVKLQGEICRLEERVDDLEQQLAQRDHLVIENQRLKDRLDTDANLRFLRLRMEIERFHEDVKSPDVPICGAMSPYHGLLEYASKVISQGETDALRSLLN